MKFGAFFIVIEKSKVNRLFIRLDNRNHVLSGNFFIKKIFSDI